LCVTCVSTVLCPLLIVAQEDDGFVLYESRAICRYLEEKYPTQGTRLVPTDLKGKALFEQAASIEVANFDSPASKAVAENYFKPSAHSIPHISSADIPTSMFGQTPNKESFDGYIKMLSEKLDVYDTILAKQKYLAGNVRAPLSTHPRKLT
jgi:glutathione S-transferase